MGGWGEGGDVRPRRRSYSTSSASVAPVWCGVLVLPGGVSCGGFEGWEWGGGGTLRAEVVHGVGHGCG